MRALFLLCSLLCLISPLGIYALEPTLTVMVPMRDGTLLPTDLYLPTPESHSLPCILIRGPSRESASAKAFASITQAGYVVAIQDTRSAIDSEGKTLPFVGDGWGSLQDGYDAVEWLAHSPYTNGKIGTWGPSALGITQLLMAPAQPPHLVCQYTLMAAASIYHHALFPGGQLLKHQAESWLGLYARDPGVQSYVCQRPFYNAFWKQLNSLEVAHRVIVPGFHVAGWYDTFLQGTLDAFTSRQEKGGEGARGRQKLVIGPWTHFWPLSKRFGDFEVPQSGINPPFDISPLRWFDHYLKGVNNQVEMLPAVTYYVMGPFDGSSSHGNVWRTADTWPIPATTTSLYLTRQHFLEKETGEAAILSYTYDPQHPIPTHGGRNLFLESGPTDQRPIEQRADLLLFTSPVLTEEIEVTGPLRAILFFSSDQVDTDLVVRLCDVYPDGRSILISEGGYRIATQSSLPAYTPGEIREISIDLGSTSCVFAPGHAIRLSISSSNYPRCEKNRNVGVRGANTGAFHIARNRLFVGSSHPSRVILPVVTSASPLNSHPSSSSSVLSTSHATPSSSTPRHSS